MSFFFGLLYTALVAIPGISVNDSERREMIRELGSRDESAGPRKRKRSGSKRKRSGDEAFE